MVPDSLARTAYHAYGGVTDWKNYQGNPMPKFDELPAKIQEAWVAFSAKVSTGGTVEEGYQAYGDVVGWKNFQGKPMPKFNEAPMTDKIVEAWHAAGKSLEGVLA